MYSQIGFGKQQFIFDDFYILNFAERQRFESALHSFIIIIIIRREKLKFNSNTFVLKCT